MEEQLSNVKAIRKIFPDSTMEELKTLSDKERQELGDLCRSALNDSQSIKA